MSSTNKNIVIEFLLSAVATATAEKYKGAVSDFKRDIGDRGVEFDTLSEEDQDWCLAEYLMEGYFSDLRRPAAMTLVSALQKFCPGRRLKTSWKVLDAWAVQVPSQQAHPCPQEVALAVTIILFVWGDWLESTAVLLCFVGLLRISEALKLRLCDIFFSMEAGIPVVIFVLGRTKRGKDQKVVIKNGEVVNWIRLVVAQRAAEGASKDMYLLPTTYKRVASRFSKACRALGLPGEWTTHSLRRGGATELLIRQVPVEDIMLFGRWASVASARLYLPRGEVAVLRCRGEFSAALQARLNALAAIGCRVWSLCKLL